MDEFMKIAKELSEENLVTGAGGPFGACIVKNGRVIGKGSNQVLKSNDPTAHAEIMAIRAACESIGSYDLSGCILYTSCYPCPMCYSASAWANISRIYYGNTREDAARIGFRDNDLYEFFLTGESSSAMPELEALDYDETIKVFEEFDRKKDKKIY